MPRRIKVGTGRKNVISAKTTINRAVSYSRQFSADTPQKIADEQYIVTIDATHQGDIKALWGEILQLISIIQDYFQGRKKKDTDNVGIHIEADTNGPNSPIININFVFNINN